MLQTIREHTQGWIAKAIISIIILSFALWGIHSYFVGGGNTNIVAQVNGVDISKEQLSVAYERLRRQMQSQQGGNSFGNDAALKERALQALIDIEVLKQASYSQGFRIFDNQIDNYLQSMPEFQVDGQFSLDRFQEVLSASLLSTNEFLSLIKTSLLIDQPKLGIIFTSFALPDETNYAILLINQERDVDYVSLPLQYFLSQGFTISPKQIETYYHDHKNDFLTPEQVTVDYVTLSLKDLASTINPSDTTLQNYYNENINAYMLPMQWKLTGIEIPVAVNASKAELAQVETHANEIYQAIQKGESFNKFTRQYTQIFNGQTWLTLNKVPSELQKVIAGLTQPDQVSQPIRTSKGFVIVKVNSVEAPRTETFDDAIDKVKEAYVRQHAEEKFSEMRERLSDLTYQHPSSLDVAAKTLSLPIQTSELFSKNKEGKDIAQYKKVREAAFSNDVLSLQNNSDVIQLNPETAIVLRIKSHLPSSLVPLNSVSAQIEDKLKNEAAEARAIKVASELKSKLQSGVPPQDLADSYNFTWTKVGYTGHYSAKIDPAILDLAFTLPNPANVQKKVVYGVTRLANGYAIVAVKGVKQGTVSDKKQFTVYAEQVQNSEGLMEYELYKRSQIRHAKIETQKS